MIWRFPDASHGHKIGNRNATVQHADMICGFEESTFKYFLK